MDLLQSSVTVILGSFKNTREVHVIIHEKSKHFSSVLNNHRQDTTHREITFILSRIENSKFSVFFSLLLHYYCYLVSRQLYFE